MKAHPTIAPRWLLGCALWAAACAQPPAPEHAATARARTSTAAATVPFVSPSSYQDFIRAELHTARGEHKQAIASYRAAVELGDSDPLLIAQLALALDRAGQTQQATALLESALANHPGSEALLIAMARQARRHGQTENALAAYARAHEVARSPASALERIAYLRELGSQERALEALRALSAQHHGSVRDRLRIDLELALLERGGLPLDGKELIGCARDWLALGGGDPSLTRRAAASLLEAGHAALALELLSAVPASEADAPLRLAATLALGRSAECEHLLSSMPPHWLGGPLAMGEAYLAAGLPEQALVVLSERAQGEEDAGTASRRAALVARSLVAAGRPRDASALLGRSADTRLLTCEALHASGLLALARDAGCSE